MHRLLRLMAEDLRDYANGDLPATPDALRRLAATLDDISERVECGAATPEPPDAFSSSRG